MGAWMLESETNDVTLCLVGQTWKGHGADLGAETLQSRILHKVSDKVALTIWMQVIVSVCSIGSVYYLHLYSQL